MDMHNRDEELAGYDPTIDLERDRRANDNKLKTTFERIFEKYARDFNGVGDEIDMATGEIVVNNGHLAFMRHERDVGRSASAQFVRAFAQELEVETIVISDSEDEDGEEGDETEDQIDELSVEYGASEQSRVVTPAYINNAEDSEGNAVRAQSIHARGLLRTDLNKADREDTISNHEDEDELSALSRQPEQDGTSPLVNYDTHFALQQHVEQNVEQMVKEEPQSEEQHTGQHPAHQDVAQIQTHGAEHERQGETGLVAQQDGRQDAEQSPHQTPQEAGVDRPEETELQRSHSDSSTASNLQHASSHRSTVATSAASAVMDNLPAIHNSLAVLAPQNGQPFHIDPSAIQQLGQNIADQIAQFLMGLNNSNMQPKPQNAWSVPDLPESAFAAPKYLESRARLGLTPQPRYLTPGLESPSGDRSLWADSGHQKPYGPRKKRRKLQDASAQGNNSAMLGGASAPSAARYALNPGLGDDTGDMAFGLGDDDDNGNTTDEQGLNRAGLGYHDGRPKQGYATNRGRRGGLGARFSPQEDELIKRLREIDGLAWHQICAYFPGRSASSVSTRYQRALKELPMPFVQQRTPFKREIIEILDEETEVEPDDDDMITDQGAAADAQRNVTPSPGNAQSPTRRHGQTPLLRRALDNRIAGRAVPLASVPQLPHGHGSTHGSSWSRDHQYRAPTAPMYGVPVPIAGAPNHGYWAAPSGPYPLQDDGDYFAAPYDMHSGYGEPDPMYWGPAQFDANQETVANSEAEQPEPARSRKEKRKKEAAPRYRGFDTTQGNNTFGILKPAERIQYEPEAMHQEIIGPMHSKTGAFGRLGWEQKRKRAARVGSRKWRIEEGLATPEDIELEAFENEKQERRARRQKEGVVNGHARRRTDPPVKRRRRPVEEIEDAEREEPDIILDLTKLPQGSASLIDPALNENPQQGIAPRQAAQGSALPTPPSSTDKAPYPSNNESTVFQTPTSARANPYFANAVPFPTGSYYGGARTFAPRPPVPRALAPQALPQSPIIPRTPVPRTSMSHTPIPRSSAAPEQDLSKTASSPAAMRTPSAAPGTPSKTHSSQTERVTNDIRQSTPPSRLIPVEDASEDELA
ncbi:hypothetical protein M8818_000872 [Zalaria obscura]|uniref:Uncharacterized protein n=1 Tax=Zalaria obscura TaxID=2024903 RepID=A0ACC3SNF4_9PEZI